MKQLYTLLLFLLSCTAVLAQGSTATYLFLGGNFYRIDKGSRNPIPVDGEERLGRSAQILVVGVIPEKTTLQVFTYDESGTEKEMTVTAKPLAARVDSFVRGKMTKDLDTVSFEDIPDQALRALVKDAISDVPAHSRNSMLAEEIPLQLAHTTISASNVRGMKVVGVHKYVRNRDKEIVSEGRTLNRKFDIAKPAELLLGISGGALFTQNHATSYRAIPAFENNERIKINGQDAFKIIGERKDLEISNSLNGMLYYAFDEEHNPKILDVFAHLVSLGTYDRNRMRHALQLGFGIGEEQRYTLGYALFLDRSNNLSVSFGLSFKNTPRLVGQRVGEFTVNQTLQTSDRFTTGLYFGVSYGITAKVAGSGNGK